MIVYALDPIERREALMLDRYLLRYFLAIVDHGNFSRAASACNVSQPTLSVGITKLERELGHKLFVRSNQRVELTDSGVRLLTPARRIEREFNVALETMGKPVDLPSLRIGVLNTVPSFIISDCISQTQPGEGYRFELVFGSERELIGHLSKGRIDVALTLVGKAGRFAEREIHTEGYTLAMRASHPLANEVQVAPEQLANESMIVRRHCESLSETSRFFTERGVRPHFALRSTNDERVLNLVAAGLGITVIPESYRDFSIARPRLAGFNVQRTLGWMLAHHSQGLFDNPPPLVQRIEESFL